MSKLRELIRHYNTLGHTFAQADAIIEASFDNRERFEDDDLDATSLQCAYLDGIARTGWTQADYEYVFNRSEETFNEAQYLKENENGECEYVDGEEYGDYPFLQQEAGGSHQRDDAGCLGHPEAGGGSLGVGEGLAGCLDLLDPQPCASSGPNDSEYVTERDDSCC